MALLYGFGVRGETGVRHDLSRRIRRSDAFHVPTTGLLTKPNPNPW